MTARPKRRPAVASGRSLDGAVPVPRERDGREHEAQRPYPRSNTPPRPLPAIEAEDKTRRDEHHHGQKTDPDHGCPHNKTYFHAGEISSEAAAACASVPE
jgi:hypothetical protein